jgi:hypothetical protein
VMGMVVRGAAAIRIHHGYCNRIIRPWAHVIFILTCITYEGPVRIQNKCLVPIYAFPEMKPLFPKQNYNVLFLSSYTHCERFIYFQDRSAYFAAENLWIDPLKI